MMREEVAIAIWTDTTGTVVIELGVGPSGKVERLAGAQAANKAHRVNVIPTDLQSFIRMPPWLDERDYG